MIDHVLVTIETVTDKKDMELPDSIPVEVLSNKLLDAFKELFPMEYKDRDSLAIYFEGMKLLGNKTLKEQYVWDGSVLKVI